MLGEGVLEGPGSEGQLRKSDDAPHADAERARLPPPPPAAGLGDRIDGLLRFMEARPGEGAFLHPQETVSEHAYTKVKKHPAQHLE